MNEWQRHDKRERCLYIHKKLNSASFLFLYMKHAQTEGKIILVAGVH